MPVTRSQERALSSTRGPAGHPWSGWPPPDGGQPDAGRPAGSGRASAPLAAVMYLALFAFGIGQAVIGVFFHAAGPAPLAAIGFDAAILATCALGGWGARSAAGALAPAAGWLVAAFMLASGPGRSGSVLIEASAAGEWFLFGGALSAVAGLAVGVAVIGRSRPGRRAVGPGRGAIGPGRPG